MGRNRCRAQSARLCLAAVLCLSGVASGLIWAGQLDEKWSGNFDFTDEPCWSVCAAVLDQQVIYKQGQPVIERQRLQDTSWQVYLSRVTSVDLNDGHYSIGMSGALQFEGDYQYSDLTFQPMSSETNCSWFLNCPGSISDESPEGSVSIELGNDCNYTITLDGVHGLIPLHYYLADFSNPLGSCGYAEASGYTETHFTEEAKTIQGTADDRDKLSGDSGPTLIQGAPAWYSDAVQATLDQVCGQAPPTECALVRSVAQYGYAGRFISSSWDLQRPSDGYWAGTFSYTKVFKPAPTTMTFPFVDGASSGIETNTIVQSDTNGVMVTFPEDGGPPSAHLFEHQVSHDYQTVRAQKRCDNGTSMPFTLDGDLAQVGEADRTISSGIGASVDTKTQADSHNAIIVIQKTPTIPETLTQTLDQTISDGCRGPGSNHNSSTNSTDFHTDKIQMTVPVKCKIQGSKTSVHGDVTDIYAWDLHFVHTADQTAAAAVRLKLGKTRTPLAEEPATQPITLSGGTIECQFAYLLSSTNTIPGGEAQASSTYRTDSAFQYAAGITNVAGAAFQAVVRASESRTNHIDTFQTQVCNESDGVTMNSTTNSVPASFQVFLVAGLTNVVPATVSATSDDDQYQVHVEIPSAGSGHCETVWHRSVQAGCADVARELERQSASETWSAGPRSLDFHGTLDSGDPTTLAGESQMARGWIRWNLKTGGSPALRLSVASTNRLLLFSWPGAPGVRLQKSKSLSSPVWQDVPNTDGSNSAALPPAEEASFFRLMKQ